MAFEKTQLTPEFQAELTELCKQAGLDEHEAERRAYNLLADILTVTSGYTGNNPFEIRVYYQGHPIGLTKKQIRFVRSVTSDPPPM
jgi:hypothetical protein